MQRILITGASGYVGRSLLNRLIDLNEYKIMVLTRPATSSSFISDYKEKVDFITYTGFISLYDFLKANEAIDVIIHAAGFVRSGLNSHEVEQNLSGNLSLTFHLLEAMRLLGIDNIINTGSYWEFDEDGNNTPNTPYSILKSTSRKLIEYYGLVYNINFINLILYDVYGENDNRTKILSKILKLKNQETLELTSAQQEITFTYIDDVIKGYLIALKMMLEDDKANHNQTYHLRNKESYSLKTAVQKLLSISKTKPNIEYGKISYSSYQLMVLPKKFQLLPGWQAEVNIQEGFNRIINQ